MNKEDYIIRSISKLRHKRWEFFIVTRIVHRIIEGDSDIEFVCQQLVRRPEGNFCLTDIYFPQLKLHLEIDEHQHANHYNIYADECREKDIIDVTQHSIVRIKIYRPESHNETKNLADIISDVDSFISKIFEERQALVDAGNWEGWNFGEKFDPDRYIKKGYLNLVDSPVFRTHRDALRCFGYQGGHYQRSTWPTNQARDSVVWFPKLYRNNDWDNSISENGETIRMSAIASNIQGEINLENTFENQNVIVFAHYTDSLGITVYRYLGEFKRAISRSEGSTVFLNRTRTKTELRGRTV